MKYVYLTDEHIAQNIIPEYVDTFPGVPITKRYSKAFLMHCVPVEDFVEVEQGMKYYPIKNRFAYPPELRSGDNFTAQPHSETTIGVQFSESVQSWSVKSDGGLTVEQAENGLRVQTGEAGGYTIELAAVTEMETAIFPLTIDVADAEPLPDPEPAPTPETSEQYTTTAEMAEAIRKGVNEV